MQTGPRKSGSGSSCFRVRNLSRPCNGAMLGCSVFFPMISCCCLIPAQSLFQNENLIMYIESSTTKTFIKKILNFIFQNNFRLSKVVPVRQRLYTQLPKITLYAASVQNQTMLVPLHWLTCKFSALKNVPVSLPGSQDPHGTESLRLYLLSL